MKRYLLNAIAILILLNISSQVYLLYGREFFLPTGIFVIGVCLLIVVNIWGNLLLKILLGIYLLLAISLSSLYFLTFYGTPLHYSVTRDFSTLTKTLLLIGFNPEVKWNSFKDSIAMTPLEWAAEQNKLNQVKLLVDGGARNAGGRTALAVASQNRNVEIVSYLLKSGINPNESNELNGMPPPLFWVMNGNKSNLKERQIEIVKLLLEAGADPNLARPHDKNQKSKELIGEATPLYEAIYINNPEIVKLLLNYGAEPNPMVYGKTILQRLHEDERFPWAMPNEENHKQVIIRLIEDKLNSVKN